MKLKLCLWAFLYCFLLAACSEEDGLKPTLAFISSQENYVLDGNKNEKVTIEFYSSYDWKAEIDADWAVVYPKSGHAGAASVTISMRESNRSMATRQGTLTLTAGNFVQTRTFQQSEIQTINVKRDEFTVPAEGQEILIEFETNVKGTPRISGYEDALEWITISHNDKNTRTVTDGSYKLTVQANRLRSERSAQFWLEVVDEEENDRVVMSSPKIDVTQEGLPVGTSADLATNDKAVKKLYTHSKGTGIPVVLMGDGFIDTEIANGFYDKVIQKGLENLFTEEPFKSLKEYFDVWSVTAVSPNNSFEDPYVTKFNCKLEGGGSTLIDGNKETVIEYVKAVSELANNPALFDETLAIVLLNTEEYAGTTYFSFEPTAPGSNRKYSEFAIGYCPIIDGVDAERFRQVLVHECVGHGFAKLLDEYSYESMGEISEEEKATYQELQEDLGWAVNVDFTDDTFYIRWSDLCQDENYGEEDAYGELLGAYEGGATYWTGVWRPTENSMMRHNEHGFNAPSRRAIYTRVMKSGIGNDWTYCHDEFVRFDQAHLPQPTVEQLYAPVSRSVQSSPALSSPRFVSGPLSE